MSDSQLVFLKPNVLVEPLFNHWLAIPHLIPPVTAAMTVANKHLPVLRSFVKLPQVHVEAMRNPRLIGGPFVNLEASRAAEVQQLIEQTERSNADLLRLDLAIKEADKLLSAFTSGESLEPLYAQLPEALRGLVELRYDEKHRPSLRWMEPLVYRSPYYRRERQSLALDRVEQDVRPFALSTPRLGSAEARLELSLPFDHPGVNALARARYQPVARGELVEQLGLGASDQDRLLPFLTREPPRAGRRYDGEGVRIRYFGHAALLIETRNVSILTDPVLSYDYPAATPPRYTHADLPERIDYVLITHAHADHLSFETLLQLRPKVGVVVVPRSNGGGQFDPSLKLMLEAIGFPKVVEIDELEQIEIEGGAITGIPFFGEHGDLDVRSKSAYGVTLAERTVVALADSNGLEPRIYRPVRELLGRIDAMFIGMESEGAPMSFQYGPMFPTPVNRKIDQGRRLNGADSARAGAIVEVLEPRRVYVYAMGQEPWLSHVMGLQYTADSPQLIQAEKFLALCRSKQIPAERPYCQMELVL